MDCLKKSIKLIIATLITLTIGVTVSSTAQAATVHYVDYDKTTENIRKRGPALPNTGTVANTVSAVFAVVLVAGGLYLVKSNKMRNIAKTVLVLGGLGTFFAFQGEVLAADSSILGQIIEQMNLDPEEIDCYDYVGFYISEETTTAGPTTTVVTTEATTTTETTTEEPTTTTEATTTTETTTTEEPTTQTMATTSTEAYTVAPTDRL